MKVVEIKKIQDSYLRALKYSKSKGLTIFGTMLQIHDMHVSLTKDARDELERLTREVQALKTENKALKELNKQKGLL